MSKKRPEKFWVALGHCCCRTSQSTENKNDCLGRSLPSPTIKGCQCKSFLSKSPFQWHNFHYTVTNNKMVEKALNLRPIYFAKCGTSNIPFASACYPSWTSYPPSFYSCLQKGLRMDHFLACSLRPPVKNAIQD